MMHSPVPSSTPHVLSLSQSDVSVPACWTEACGLCRVSRLSQALMCNLYRQALKIVVLS